MIIDVHNHIGKPEPGLEVYQTPERLISEMDIAGVDKAIIFGFPEYSFNIVENNDYIFESIKKYPGRLIGFSLVNPWSREKAVKELERCVNKLGFKGLKLHPAIHHFSLNAHSLTDAIFEECSKLKIPIISHGQGDCPHCTPAQFGDMAETFPDVPLIMAHMGFWQNTEDAISKAMKYDNLYLDTTMNNNVESLRKAVDKAGAEKLVFGTDTPGPSMQVEIMKINVAIPDRKKRELILGGNISKILKI
ncbi:MAG: amidohydrolase family protein [Nitrososphaeria archaeon]